MKVICLLLPESMDSREHVKITLAEICWRFTPVIAVGPHWIFLDIAGCEKIYSVQLLLMRLQVHCKRLQVPVRFGLAHDASTALAYARYGKRDKKYLPLEALYFYLNPFQVELGEKNLNAFFRLGLKVLSDVEKISRPSLLRRFGPGIVQAMQYFSNGDPRPWPRFYLTETIEENLKIDFTDRIQNVEPLLFLLTPVLERIGERLKTRGQALLSFQFLLRQEESAVVENLEYDFHFELAQAQNKPKLLLPIIKERLEKEFRIRPLETSVGSASFKVRSTAPLIHAQNDFLRVQEEKMQEELQQLILRISSRLGNEKVFKASLKESHIPEKTWERTGLDVKPLNKKFPRRPLRLLKKPIPLERDRNIFCSQGRNWRMLAMQGPERIDTEWWMDRIERDYFFVWTEEGEKLWVYLVPSEGRYYLHGVFD